MEIEHLTFLQGKAVVGPERKIGVNLRNLPQGDAQGRDQDRGKERETMTVVGLLTIDLQNITIVINIGITEIETEKGTDTIIEIEITEVMTDEEIEIEYQNSSAKN